MVLDSLTGSVRASLPAAIQAWLPAPVPRRPAGDGKRKRQAGGVQRPQNRYAFCLTCANIR